MFFIQISYPSKAHEGDVYPISMESHIEPHLFSHIPERMVYCVSALFPDTTQMDMPYKIHLLKIQIVFSLPYFLLYIETTPIARSCLLSELFFYFTWSRSTTKSSTELSLPSRSMSLF